MMLWGVIAAAGVIIAAAWHGWVLWRACRRLGDIIGTAADTAASTAAEAPYQELLGRMEALERRMTDVADVTERRYRAILMRDRRAADAEAAPDVAPPVPTPAAAPTRPRLVRRYRRG